MHAHSEKAIEKSYEYFIKQNFKWESNKEVCMKIYQRLKSANGTNSKFKILAGSNYPHKESRSLESVSAQVLP